MTVVDCSINSTQLGDTTLKGARRNDWDIQSSEAETVGTEVVADEQQTMSFTKETSEAVNYAAIYDSMTEEIYSSNYDLGDFFKRPIRLYHETFPVGSPYTATTKQVWYDVLNTASLKRKMDNFSYMQATLKIKMVVNSTPFNYGLVGVSYAPLTGFTTIDTFSNSAICLSQRPTVYIDISKGETYEMQFPFFYYKNWLDITSAADVQGMGSITIWQVAQCATANAGVTSTPSVTIFGWLEDVKLYGNTATLTLQSGEETSGPVSSVASTIASAASYFENIPIIGRFAKATSLGAGAIGAIATLFGFSNNPVISDASPYKSMPFHGFASSEISNVIEKLTLDPNNELTISPTTVGLPPVDELAIVNLVSKESIISTPLWLTTDATDTLLFSANVTPTMCLVTTPVANQVTLRDTAMGNVARMFSNWRGDICYHVKIIKTPYHKGTLRVQYDPKGGLTSTNSIENVVITKIVDISTVSDFIVRVPYMAPQSFLRVNATLQNDFAGNAASLSTYDPDYHNGRLTIKVVNNLTAPLDTASLRLIVSVMGAENLEFANPSPIETTSGLNSPFQIQSAEEDTVTVFEMGNCGQISTLNYDVHMGERIGSIRALLRRSHFIGYESIPSTTKENYHYRMEMTKYPPIYGYDPLGIHSAHQINGAGTDSNFNFVWNSPFQYMQGCFIGMRGSTMWHFNGLSGSFTDSMRVLRLTEPVATDRASIRRITASAFGASYSDSARVSLSRSKAADGGCAVINQKTQTGLSVLLPQYNKFKFVTASPANSNYGRASDDTINEKFWLEIFHQNTEAMYPGFERYFSIGPDFNFFFYLNSPPRYFYAAPTAGTF